MSKTPPVKSHWPMWMKAGVFSALAFLPGIGHSAQTPPDELLVKPTVKPLDLSRTPTREELMQAGQLGGQLVPTSALDVSSKVGSAPAAMSMSAELYREAASADKVADEQPQRSRRRKRSLNQDDEIAAMFQDFGTAIQAWNRHDYKEAYQLFDQYKARYPNSPWTGEAILHMGCEARFNGRYNEAKSTFLEVIDRYRSQSYVGAKWLGDKAVSRLAVLNVLENNLDEALKLFSDLQQNSVDWRLRTYASGWIMRLSQQKANRLALLDCGTRALAHMLEQDGKAESAKAVLAEQATSLQGHSIADLTDLAAEHGYQVNARQLAIGDLSHIPLPAVVQIDRSGNSTGHYWILEKVTAEGVTLHDPQMGRRFEQTLAEFDREWGGHTLVFGGHTESLPGLALNDSQMADIYGGCCGVQRPESNLGEPDNGEPDEEDCAQGAPIWKVNMANMNLFMKDIPLWYKPAIGPAVSLQLNYNAQSAIAQNEPFGNKWSFNYGSYLVVDPGKAVTVFMPDGARHVYVRKDDGSYTAPYGVYNQLLRHSEHHFELTLPSGQVYEYNLPAGTDSMQPFLVAIKDPYGQQLSFAYNAQVKLATITDALGQTTTLTYNDAGLVTEVADPFGRKAVFAYDEDRNLIQLTDMGGYWTKVSYDEAKYVTSVENPLGKWGFRIEAADGINNGSVAYNPPGTAMWDNYRITITDPNGNKEEYYYDGYHGTAWYVSPNNYVEYKDSNTNNYKSATKTSYTFFTKSDSKGRIKTISYPDGRVIEYQYDSKTGEKIGRQINGKGSSFPKNSQGKITELTNALGQKVSYQYADNGKDVTQITTPQGTIELQYDAQHNPTTIKDVTGRETQLTYNSYGQLTSMQVGEQQRWEYQYNGQYQLTSITFNGETTKQYTYDDIGRVKSITDETGAVQTFSYNGLDSATVVTYADGKQTTTTYGQCPRLVTSETDRGGRTYRYEYDAAKQLTKIISPEGTATQFEYDANGNLITLIDANRNATRFEFNKADQLTAKVFADGSKIQYTYDKGKVKTRTNARGIKTTYEYDAQQRLTKIDYADDTPDVTYTYNAQGQVTQVSDGLGTHKYTYATTGKLASIDGPWDDDTLTYEYDSSGVLHKIVPSKGQSVARYFDQLGRLSVIEAGDQRFIYRYQGVSPQPRQLVFPSNLVTQYHYDNVNRLDLISHHKGKEATLAYFKLTYNAQDLLAKEEYETPLEAEIEEEQLETSAFNELNQLTDINGKHAVDPVHYKDGNRTTGRTKAGYTFTATYDAENRLSTINWTDKAGTAHERRYRYGADHLLGEIQVYVGGDLKQTTRLIRHNRLVLQERNADNTITREYVWGAHNGGGIGGLLSLTESNAHYYYLYNPRGNVIGVVNQQNELVAAYDYSPYGELTASNGTLNQPYRYATKRYDDALGFSYFGYRYYITQDRVWLTRDPSGESGGINLYQYVKSDPINQVDHWGLIGNNLFGPSTSTPRNFSPYLNPGYTGSSFMERIQDAVGNKFDNGNSCPSLSTSSGIGGFLWEWAKIVTGILTGAAANNGGDGGGHDPINPDTWIENPGKEDISSPNELYRDFQKDLLIDLGMGYIRYRIAAGKLFEDLEELIPPLIDSPNEAFPDSSGEVDGGNDGFGSSGEVDAGDTSGGFGNSGEVDAGDSSGGFGAGNTWTPSNSNTSDNQGAGSQVEISKSGLRHIRKHIYGEVAKQLPHVLRNKGEAAANEKIDTGFFPKEWSNEQVTDAATQVYNEALRKGIKNDTYTTTVNGEKISVFVNEEGGFSTAYGHKKYTLDDFDL
ncbi:RHS repeat-associated core domain-containing protein [Zooshikella ganghwensis]|uniref:RHS repeat-associated core domain-containing protein n=1 Tax=Zooshikella ganghwensis TaxID=202772 RepID=UPI0003F54AA2|nr:RHS repeat-associated core domain-containing protein [Zooshikella ganghwensis]